MKALIVNCTLKANPEQSNTGALADVLAGALREEGVEVDEVRAADHAIPPGVESDLGEDDEWPAIRDRILDAEILIVATPTWLGRPSSIAQRVLERMDAMISETDDDEAGHDWAHSTGRSAAGNLLAVARALEASPIPPPSG